MSLKLFLCGDVVNFKAKTDYLDTKLETLIKSCDISICNFEAPIKHEDMQMIKKAGPHLYQSKESVEYLKKAGFDLFSLANNHIYDYGEVGLNTTLEEIKRCKLNYVGAGSSFDEAYSPVILDKKGVKVGFMSVAEAQFGCLMEDEQRGGYAFIHQSKTEDNIRELRNECDIVVLIAHAGVEDISLPIPEWRNAYKRFCDLGCDLVIAHHPHVPQGYEMYNGSTIFYSLGNFFFDTAGFENTSNDSFSLSINANSEGITDFEIIYHKMENGKVKKVSKDEVNFDLDHLNKSLEIEYEDQISKLVLQLFNDVYLPYYESALHSYPLEKSFKNKVYYMLKNLLNNNVYTVENMLLLLHNIQIDSHRYVVQRALKIITGDDSRSN